MADARTLGMTATHAACAAAILVLLAQPAPAHAPGLHHQRVIADEAALLNVVSAELFDRDGSGDASPGDEVRLQFRRRLGSEPINPLAPACQNVFIPDRGEAKAPWCAKPFSVRARDENVHLGIISAVGRLPSWVSFRPHSCHSLAKIAAMCNPNEG